MISLILLKKSKVRNLLFFFIFLLTFIFNDNCRKTTINIWPQEEIILSDMILKLQLIISPKGGDQYNFSSPISFETDVEGNIYVLDNIKNKIFVSSKEGKFITFIKVPNKFKKYRIVPIDISVDDNREGIIYLLCAIRIKAENLIFEYDKKWKYLFNIKFRSKHLFYAQNSIYITDNSYAGQFLIYRCSKEKKVISAFGKILTKSKNDRKSDLTTINEVNFVVDQEGNVILAYKFKPKLVKYSPKGEILFEVNFFPEIKNKKPPIVPVVIRKEILQVEKTSRGSRASGRFVIRGEEYPICYDLAADSKGNLFLLIARDHQKKESCELYRFNPSGKLIEKVRILFPTSNIEIDKFNNFYFLSTSVNRKIYKYYKIKDK